jgi:hypothetical protein
MLNMAMVCCTPPLLSWTLTGWRIALMPTLLIAIWRVSALFWTSGMLGLWCVHVLFSRINYLVAVGAHGCARCRVGRGPVRRAIGLVAVVDEAVGQAKAQNRYIQAVFFSTRARLRRRRRRSQRSLRR